jgi:hypothetical protein
VELGANLAKRLRQEVNSEELDVIEGDITAVTLPESAFDWSHAPPRSIGSTTPPRSPHWPGR